MKTICRLALPALVSVALVTSAGVAQPTTMKQQLIGSWVLVSFSDEQASNKVEPFGPNPKGTVVFEGNGRFAQVIMRSGLPKFASNNRATGSPEENKAIVQGSLAFFGTYSVDEADRAVILHVESATFPNWDGTDRKLPVATLAADELRWINAIPSVGSGTFYLVWKRAK